MSHDDHTFWGHNRQASVTAEAWDFILMIIYTVIDSHMSLDVAPGLLAVLSEAGPGLLVHTHQHNTCHKTVVPDLCGHCPKVPETCPLAATRQPYLLSRVCALAAHSVPGVQTCCLRWRCQLITRTD